MAAGSRAAGLNSETTLAKWRTSVCRSTIVIVCCPLDLGCWPILAAADPFS